MSQGAVGSQDNLNPARDRPRVLIVEDDRLIASLLKDLIEDQGCVAVGPASRLDQAIALINNERVDVALLDVSLGGEMVFPAAELLKQSDIPFVFLTGHRHEILPREFEGHAILRKPFTPRSLVRAMHEATARRQRTQ